MGQFHRFLRLLQTARAMPQTGYVLGGVKKSDLSDLAQHHYLVTITGWYLANLIIKNKGKINVERVLEICLIHDLGELFGGDIAIPYGLANPVARKLAKRFEGENQRYLTKFLAEIGQTKELFEQANDLSSDEALVAKIADYIEVTEYKQYLGRLTDGDITLVTQRILKMSSKIKNRPSQIFLSRLVVEWSSALMVDNGTELLESVNYNQ